MKKSTLIRLHLYCGLFTAFYILAFGLSTIVLNHNMDVEIKAIKNVWTDQVDLDADLELRALSFSVRDQLGMMGWVPPWLYNKTDTNFEFTITSPGKNNRLNLDLKTGQVEVSEIPKGFIAVFQGLHFFNGRVPNAPFFLKTWIVYQWLGLIVLAISLILGVWLWGKYNKRNWEYYAFGGLFLFTCLIMWLL